MLRPIGMTLLFSVSCIAVVGCGSSQSTATVAAAGTAADNAVSVAKAHARAYARQVNITQADVPGAEVIADEKESRPPSQKALEAARCAGAVLPDRRIADIKSAALRIGNVVDEATRVKSSIEVQPSAAIAVRNYAVLASARDRSCIERDLPPARGRRGHGPRTHWPNDGVSPPTPVVWRAERLRLSRQDDHHRHFRDREAGARGPVPR